jgi:hypothetical protein
LVLGLRGLSTDLPQSYPQSYPQAKGLELLGLGPFRWSYPQAYYY